MDEAKSIARRDVYLVLSPSLLSKGHFDVANPNGLHLIHGAGTVFTNINGRRPTGNEKLIGICFSGGVLPDINYVPADPASPRQPHVWPDAFSPPKPLGAARVHHYWFSESRAQKLKETQGGHSSFEGTGLEFTNVTFIKRAPFADARYVTKIEKDQPIPAYVLVVKDQDVRDRTFRPDPKLDANVLAEMVDRYPERPAKRAGPAPLVSVPMAAE